MANTIKKQKTEDVFAGLKHVDNMLNEAAGVKEPTETLSFEDKLKAKLKEFNQPKTSKTIVKENEELPPPPGQDPYAIETRDEAYMEDDNNDVEMLDAEKEIEEELKEYGYKYKGATYNYDDSNALFSEAEQEKLNEILFEDDDELTAEVPEAAPEVSADMPSVPSDPAPQVDSESETPAGEVGVEPTAETGDLGPITDTMPSEAPMASAEGEPSEEPVGEVPSVVTTAIGAPEDIDAMIDELIQDAEEKPGTMIAENKELKDLGYEDLKDEDLKGSAPKTSKTVKAKVEEKTKEEETITEGEDVKFKKLGDDDITGKVKGAETGKAPMGNKESTKGKAALDKLGFSIAKDESVEGKATKVKDEKGGSLKQPSFDSVKKESIIKSKALVKLAEKHVTLEEEYTKLKFEHYKALKVNGVLTLLPELNQSTREALVEKFDKCDSYAKVRSLYTEVTNMVKESRKSNINEAVRKAKGSDIKSVAVNENVTVDGQETITPEQARKNFLMGVKGYDDQYFM